ncbi:MAG: 30S ribosomal protein S6 [Spirochaetales bacterium]|nr:30S ribosomal protein S6 [Spirochaetales bacterium]
MRKYELMVVFGTKENKYVTGVEAVKKVLDKRSAKIESEEDRGDRELAYEVENEQHGHYHLFNLDIDPESIVKIEEDLKLVGEILKYIFVRKEG